MAHIHRVNIVTEREEVKQQKLTDVFIKKVKSMIPLSSKRSDDRYILARRISLWFAKDLLPFSLVQCKGFSDFWNSLHPHASLPALPSPQTISISALDDMYECMHAELIRVLNQTGGRQYKCDQSFCVYFNRIIFMQASNTLFVIFFCSHSVSAWCHDI